MIGRTRRGFTLVEVVVVMAAGAAVLTLGVAMIQALLKLDRASKAKVAEGATLSRLARALRDDAHAADRATLINGDEKSPARLEFALPGDRVATYRVEGREVRRELAESGELDAFERFRLPRAATARFDLVEEDGLRVVGLAVDRPPGQVGAAGMVGLRVEAVVGRDHRFEKGD